MIGRMNFNVPQNTPVRIVKRFDIEKSPWIKLERIIYDDGDIVDDNREIINVPYEESNENGSPLNLGMGLKYWDVFSRRSLNPDNNPHSATSMAFGYKLDEDNRNYAIFISVVEQYRASVNKFTLEFPSGICDSGESVTECALRELKEETGFTGTAVDGSSYLPTSVLCGDSTSLVTILIDLDKDANKTPCQQLETTENIKVHMFPLADLLKNLLKHSNESGSIISESLYVFAYVLSLFPNDVSLHYITSKIKDCKARKTC